MKRYHYEMASSISHGIMIVWVILLIVLVLIILL